MTNPMRDSLNDEVLYPDDLTGIDHLETAHLTPLEAEEVDHENAQFGQFVELNGDGPPHWAAAPRQLREFLANAYDEHGSEEIGFRVTEAERGDRDHDPWEIEAQVTHVDGTKIE